MEGGRMEGVSSGSADNNGVQDLDLENSGVQDLDLENSFGNVAEHTSFDASADNNGVQDLDLENWFSNAAEYTSLDAYAASLDAYAGIEGVSSGSANNNGVQDNGVQDLDLENSFGNVVAEHIDASTDNNGVQDLDLENWFSNAAEHTSLDAYTGIEGVSSVSADNNGVQDLDLENSCCNVEEHTSLDAYARGCNSTSDLSDQMFPTFALSPFTFSPTNFSLFDELNFPNQQSSEISLVDDDIMENLFISGDKEKVDDDIMENLFISGDKEKFHQTENQLPFATNCAPESFDLIEMRDTVHISITRPPLQSLADKILIALNLFKEWSGRGILAQLWVPMLNGDRYILSTREQPYLLDQTLSGYREVSRSFTFATETKPDCFLGLPGRVFVSKIPEWTSNVVYYNKAEYIRLQHAVDHKVRGSIAMPVFEDNLPGRLCCAVLELVTVKEKSNFDVVMENVCGVLEAVNLRSVLPPRLYPQSFSVNQKIILAEIADGMRAICFAHRLPLALTWIPCSYIEDAGAVTLNLDARGKYVLCLVKDASYLNDKDMEGFVHACEKHYLEPGEGIAGKALQSNLPFFHHDVMEYHISEYPLVHHARKFGLKTAVAIRLRSLHTGDTDYILELFLPGNTKGSTEQQFLLNNLSSTMQKICKSLRTVSDAELHSIVDCKDKSQDAETKRIPETSLCSGNSKIVDPINQDLYESTATRVEVDVPIEQCVLDSVQGVEGGLKFDPTIGGFVSAGSVIKELDSRNRVVLPNKNDNHFLRETGLVIQSSKPATTSSFMENETTIETGYGSGSMMNDSSSSSRSFGKMQNDASWGDNGSTRIVKATYKEDTIRFKFEPASGYLQLCEEVASRFKLHTGHFQLKYPDDENEWVLLVNDSDLQECLEIFSFAGTRVVKFLVQDVSTTLGSSGGSNCFLGEGS